MKSLSTASEQENDSMMERLEPYRRESDREENKNMDATDDDEWEEVDRHMDSSNRSRRAGAGLGKIQNEIDRNEPHATDGLVGDEENDDDSTSDEDDDYDEKVPSSWFADLQEMWKQHLIAILVAIVATVVAHRHLGSALGNTNSGMSSLKDPLLLESHAFLANYQRTANISFCGVGIQGNPDLRILEFAVSEALVPTLARHWLADRWLDDSYERVLPQDEPLNDNLVARTLTKEQHSEYVCLQRQLESSSKSFVKGLSYYYPSPTIESMYPNQKSKPKAGSRKKAPKLSAVHLTFTGFAVKFVNLANYPVLVHWEGRKRRLIGELGPYESIGTAATSAGQSFSLTRINDSKELLEQWIVTADNPVLYYDPPDTDRTPAQEARYQFHKLNRAYAREYLIVTKRAWLSNFPRPLPVWPMWPAVHFQQSHVVETTAVTENFDDKSQQLTLEVASVTPRVFTIRNFLSKEECQQLMDLAQATGLQPSTLQASSSSSTSFTRARQQRDKSTRSSANAWLSRGLANLTDLIYQRAANVLQIPEHLLQKEIVGDDYHHHHHSLAESLQVVRYKVKEEYTAHHDFVYPPTFHRHQPSRFATLLMYLNDDFEGGETVFPRAVNTQHHEGITIKPVQGTAVLFYNVLPDGNFDDLSQHASNKVTKGEKWLANLWVWEPHIY